MVAICLLLQFSLVAQTSATLHVATAGTLPTLISANDKTKITNLTLTGNLNGTDILFIREMAGRNANNKVTDGQLSELDLSNAKIVKGGDNYYSFFGVYADNTLTSYMFYNCTNLTRLILPNSIINIDSSAVEGCSGLTNITIPNGVNIIQFGAFKKCSALTNVTIPNSVTTIDQLAFYNCTSLKSITIPNSVTYIGESAFGNCSSLKSATIGIGLKTLVFDSFENCESLVEFIVAENNIYFSSSTDGVLFNNDKTTILQYPAGKPNTSYSIPNSVTTIGGCSFKGCSILNSITIPENVTNINASAFRNCLGLSEIHCKAVQPPYIVSQNTFSNYTTCKLYVPIGSYNLYTNALFWEDFATIIEEDFSSVDGVSNDNISVKTTAQGIAIDTTNQTSVMVYSLSGQALHQSVVDGYTEIALGRGLYIVTANGKSSKVEVK